ncbi:MAG: lipopolysaccharide biosynthesis protein RfbH [Deltaproteobacteria bacterium]|nr:lipopolysaccharide biosynthesis protein RfbH [Deltaproteobacteria bacterium]
MVGTEALRADLKQVLARHKNAIEPKALIPGVDYLPASGKVVGPEELELLLMASADLWLTAGRFSDEFEEKFPRFWGSRKCLLVNSGSSANLLAFSALTSPTLKDRMLKREDEFITTACGFPTTVAPAVQYGMKPIFVDVDVATHNASVDDIIAAISPKTKLIMIAHALGNPYRADKLVKICEEKNIWLIEDCCDALGATIEGKHVGTFGALSTCSFYPAHHITMGEGGAVLINNALLGKVATSFRDWGRDCWCPPGQSNTCGIRFEWKMGELPKGYDHKYIYSHLGYNLKLTDFQAAVGLAQLERLPGFIEARRNNFTFLKTELIKLGLEEHFTLPKATEGTNPSWFGFFLCGKGQGSEFRNKIVTYLEENKIGTRLLFGGNLTKQPAFKGIPYSIHSTLKNTDKIMEEGFWVGVWPGLSEEHLSYIAKKINEAVKL